MLFNLFPEGIKIFLYFHGTIRYYRLFPLIFQHISYFSHLISQFIFCTFCSILFLLIFVNEPAFFLVVFPSYSIKEYLFFLPDLSLLFICTESHSAANPPQPVNNSLFSALTHSFLFASASCPEHRPVLQDFTVNGLQ